MRVKRASIYITLLLLAFTGAMVTSALWTYKLSMQAAMGNLKTAATNMAVNLDFTLNNLGLRRYYFQKLVSSGDWEAVAFLALYNRDSEVLLHSNINLIGLRMKDPHIQRVFATGIPMDHFMTLGTGEKVYVLDYPLHYHREGKLRTEVLRIALHTYPAMGVVRKARFQLTLSLAATGVLWILTFLLIFYIRRSIRMERQLAEKERLALLGEMAAILAHEIRNPIGSIKGFAQLLMEKKEDDSPEREFLQTMVEECIRLEKLVRDLLHYAREERLRLSTFLLKELVEECVKQSEGQREDIKLAIEISDNLTITSDRDKLKQILLNLIQNSQEAMKQEGTLTIRAHEKGDKIVLEIQDQGKGMTPEVRERIFQPFFTTKSQGTGLGMAIVKKLTEQLEGQIHVESSYGQGSVFRLILPKKVSPQ
ncbi:MAG: hypothetical protein DRI93_03635 [Aquificota bacterium]|nr:MAG: hypothetical protein DRI93_03635 [Aquificota bacterium]